MKHIRFTADLTNWGLNSIDELSESIDSALRKTVAEVLQLAFEDDQTEIYFPVQWSKEPGEECEGSDGIGGIEVADPLTVYLRVAIGEAEAPTFSFNLREALQDTMDGCAEDGSWSRGLARLSGALRQLADDIDTARDKSNKRYHPHPADNP